MKNFIPVKHLYSLSLLSTLCLSGMTFLSIKIEANGTDKILLCGFTL